MDFWVRPSSGLIQILDKGSYCIPTVGALTARVWYAVAFIFTGPSSYTLNFNGIMRSCTWSGTSSPSLQSLSFGSFSTSDSRRLNGRLDTVSIFSTALNASQVNAMINGDMQWKAQVLTLCGLSNCFTQKEAGQASLDPDAVNPKTLLTKDCFIT